MKVNGLIAETWPQLLAYSQKQFAEFGRGAVVLTLEGVDIASGALSLPVAYFTESCELAEQIGGFPDELLALLVDEYDPATEAVISIIHKGRRLSYTLVRNARHGPMGIKIFKHSEVAGHP